MAKDIYTQHPIMEFLSRLFDILILNFFTLLTSIPVITIPAAASSMYYVMFKIIRDEDSGTVKLFFRFFADNFLKSLPYALVIVPVQGILYLALFSMAYGNEGGPVAFGLSLGVLAIVTVLSVWSLLLFAQFDNSFGRTVINAVKLTVFNPLRSLAILAANGLMAVLLLFAPAVFIYFLALWIFMGAGIIGFISAKTAVPVFDELMPEREEIPDPLEEELEDDEEESGE